MKIGELAAATGTQVETIRYYEREGLLPEAARTASNYRTYDASHVRRLAFIRHCRCLDMTLDEVRVLLHYKDSPRENCGEVDQLLDEHIGHVVTRIKELKALEKELRALRDTCSDGRAAADCGILEGLEHAASVHDHGALSRGQPRVSRSHQKSAVPRPAANAAAGRAAPRPRASQSQGGGDRGRTS